jgi:hypothetical protein
MNKREAAIDIIGTFVEGIANAAKVPDGYFVVGWDHNLYIAKVKEGKGSACGIHQAKLFHNRAEADYVAEFTKNGGGVVAKVYTSQEARERSIAETKAHIVTILENAIPE